jgi:hypothetical protein
MFIILKNSNCKIIEKKIIFQERKIIKINLSPKKSYFEEPLLYTDLDIIYFLLSYKSRLLINLKWY